MTKILIDMGHPFDVHFWKNFIWEMEKLGHEFKVIVREKDTLKHLLGHYEIPYTSIGEARVGTFGKAVGMVSNDSKLLKCAKEFKPDVITGFGSPYVAQTAKLIRRPSVIFTDTEHAKLINKLTVPFATYVITPSCFEGDFGIKHIRCNGYFELAYLHPERFKEKGIGKRNIVMRLSSWDASHDNKRQVLEDFVLGKFGKKLSEYGNVVTSHEGGIMLTLGDKLYGPHHLHAIMKNAILYVGDGATMATESALLGVPAVYVSPLAGTMGNHNELNKYGLLYSLKHVPNDEFLEQIIGTPRSLWRSHRKNMLKDKIDVTGFMIEFFEGLE